MKEISKKKLRRQIYVRILALVSSMVLVVVLVFAMTAAWFTNVAKTSDLILKAESWGFDESKIVLGEETITIAPGTFGVIPLSIDNSDGEETVRMDVTISKAAMMPEKLQKRIYFYADTPRTIAYEAPDSETGIATETVSRVYLGASAPDNYTYKILPGQTIHMSELFYNAVPIKWEWVFDMLGYYFRGTVTASDDWSQTSFAVDEYLRPIEYDYEQAVFDLEEDEAEDEQTYYRLMRIGEMTRDEFLVQLSGEDGYAGAIDPEMAVPVAEAYTDEMTGEEKQAIRYYYPVEVDDKGYGIWAYLCGYDEIKEGFAFDTELANKSQAGESVTAEATIYMTAYNVPVQTTPVTTEAEVKAALADDETDVVQLTEDIYTGSTIAFKEGNKVLDLNGYALGYDGTEEQYYVLSVSDGAELTVVNGKMTGDEVSAGTIAAMKSYAVRSTGGNVVLNGVEVSGFDCAVLADDYMAETAADSVIQIVNCDLVSDQVTVLLQGNGDVSKTMTKMIIENSTLTSLYYSAISGQGNDERWGTELLISDCTIDGYYSGIYQPQRQSVTTITDSTITGNTGLVLKGGTMNIYDSVVRGTGLVDVSDAKVLGSGYTDTGDGVYVEAGYKWAANLNLYGSNEIISDAAYAVEMIGDEDLGPGRIRIYNGAYSGAKGCAKWNEYGTFEIYGGSFAGETVDETITRYDGESAAE